MNSFKADGVQGTEVANIFNVNINCCIASARQFAAGTFAVYVVCEQSSQMVWKLPSILSLSPARHVVSTRDYLSFAEVMRVLVSTVGLQGTTIGSPVLRRAQPGIVAGTVNPDVITLLPHQRPSIIDITGVSIANARIFWSIRSLNTKRGRANACRDVRLVLQRRLISIKLGVLQVSHSPCTSYNGFSRPFKAVLSMLCVRFWFSRTLEDQAFNQLPGYLVPCILVPRVVFALVGRINGALVYFPVHHKQRNHKYDMKCMPALQRFIGFEKYGMWIGLFTIRIVVVWIYPSVHTHSKMTNEVWAGCLFATHLCEANGQLEFKNIVSPSLSRLKRGDGHLIRPPITLLNDPSCPGSPSLGIHRFLLLLRAGRNLYVDCNSVPPLLTRGIGPAFHTRRSRGLRGLCRRR